MSQPITLEDIYRLFQAAREADEARAIEHDRRMREHEQWMAEQEQFMAEHRRWMAEQDQRRAEQRAEIERRLAEQRAEIEHYLAQQRAEIEHYLAQQRAENERLVAEAKAEADRARAEQEERLRLAKEEANRARAELERELAQLSKSVNGLTTRWGRFVEGLVEPAVVDLFQARGIDVQYVFHRVYTKKPGYAMEIDIMVINDTELVIVECKSRLSKDDVDEFVQKLGRFKQSFPRYASYRVYGAVAAIEIDEGVDRYAFRQGLFVIKPAGDTVAIVNDQAFQPHSW